jgi:hypothetical protein
MLMSPGRLRIGGCEKIIMTQKCAVIYARIETPTTLCDSCKIEFAYFAIIRGEDNDQDFLKQINANFCPYCGVEQMSENGS